MRAAGWKLFAGVLALSFVGSAEEDGPGRGVARISLLNGDVSMRRGDTGDWTAAALNAPLVVQDHLLTGPSSRAEVQFDWANVLRLASNSELRFSELEDRRYQVQLARGMAMLVVLRDIDADLELNTPNVSVRPVKKGMYRVQVTEGGETEVTVRSGEVEVFTPRGVERLRSGRTLRARGTASDPEYQIVSASGWDDWDRWNERRDRQLLAARSYQYVNRDIYGAEDLDYYGSWVSVAPYGWVWSPRAAIGWAPYRYGRWAWIDWYGWNWVSYDPWGWAPYHYGRWFYHRPYGWCWFPGPVYQRHYWRPALVAFFGWGHYSGFHVGIGFGNVGWVPLAPYEPFYPWYGRGWYGGFRNRVFIDNSVRVVNNVNITNIYRNARVNDGVTYVGADDFVRGRPGRVFRGADAEIRRASLVQGPVPVTPAAESLRLSDRNVQGNLPRTLDDRRFVSRRQPASIERVPFEDQRRGMEQMVRRTFGETGQPGVSVRAAGTDAPRGEAPRGESGNLSRIGAGEARRSDTTPLPRTESGNLPRAAEDRGGWRRVGESQVTTQQRDGGDRRTGVFGAWQKADEPMNRRGATDEGWRRFGEPGVRSESGAVPRAEQPVERRVERDSNWRRFGESGQEGGLIRREQPEATGRTDRGIARESGDGWRRFGNRPSGGTVEPQPAERSRPLDRGERSRGETVEREAPRSRWDRSDSPRSSPRSESRSWEGSRRSGGEPVMINPPIVRERSSPRFESRGGSERSPMPRGGGDVFRGGGGEMRGGGGVRSAPSGGGGEVRSAPRGDGGERGGGRSGR